MYGAFWCTHCYDQKQEFGAQAMAEFPYVECFPEGWKKVRGGPVVQLTNHLPHKAVASHCIWSALQGECLCLGVQDSLTARPCLVLSRPTHTQTHRV